ncbi:MAG: indole-3-glycerol phosphate synthase TrpC [Leptospiraceae bacterium]|nr:indole-3-glycerol phosphate synthase TrpC [Leptospiraceae bacterium]MCK6379852.1 indole-3-glycerol phosphate synthase TrpC [Leptospiraceae bacterium]NUM42507.1 indole-3-glycerol phosphate synthase TrpC [Leptospiraceae bacterium]
MSSILQKIIDTKRNEIQSIPNYDNLPVVKYSFSDSLFQKSGIIAECKKASPSKGVIVNSYNPTEIAKIYEKSGASAVSVLTDSLFFQGSLQDLKNVSDSVSIPVLRKDFIIDEKQIREAIFYGASAILLIVRILDSNRLKELLGYAETLGLEVLVEIHNKNEAEIALNSGAKIIGINTRDLDTLQIHKGLIQELTELLPNSVLKVAESGINGKEDYLGIKKYTRYVLIGTYFMQSSDIANSFSNLLKN